MSSLVFIPNLVVSKCGALGQRPIRGISRTCRPFGRRTIRSQSRRLNTKLVAASGSDAAAPLRAVEGDIVTIHWSCIKENGEILERSTPTDEAATFEIGAGAIVGNRLFEAFDEAVRGLAVGDTVSIKAEGGPWKEELLFTVPREHEEIQRLEGRYKNQGGVQEGQLVELSNGGMALVVKCSDAEVVLDANSMMAGKNLTIELNVINIERPPIA